MKRLFSFLILMPQLSFFRLDMYIVLLITLTIKNIKNIFYLDKLYLYLFILFTIIMFLQVIFANTSLVIGSHTRYGEYREMDTFGYLSATGVFGAMNYIKIIVLLIFSSFIYKFLRQLTVFEIKNILLTILYLSAIIQVLFYIFHILGILDFIITIFFTDNVRSDGSFAGAVTFREGLVRLSGGFSEPSMLALVYFIVISCLFTLIKSFDIKVSFTQKILVFLSWIIVFITTLAYTHLVSLVVILLIVFNLKNILLNMYLALIIFSVELIHYEYKDTIGLVGSSFTARLSWATDISSLSLYQLLYGVELSNFYSFITSINFILQLGIVGTMGFVFIIWIRFRSLQPMLLIFIVLFISPRLTDTWLYILFALLLTINYKIKEKII
jgi:hypothetical protein